MDGGRDGAKVTVGSDQWMDAQREGMSVFNVAELGLLRRCCGAAGAVGTGADWVELG